MIEVPSGQVAVLQCRGGPCDGITVTVTGRLIESIVFQSEEVNVDGRRLNRQAEYKFALSATGEEWRSSLVFWKYHDYDWETGQQVAD